MDCKHDKDPYCVGVSGGADLILYAAMNVAGLYTKFLTDRAGRKAFLETRRSLEMRCKAAKENSKQEKLLLSGTVQYVPYQKIQNIGTHISPVY